MVQRDQWHTYWGVKNVIFLIRDIDDHTMAGVSVESCRFVVLRSPQGRLGSVLDMGSRLRRMHRCFQQWIQIKTGPQAEGPQQLADQYYTYLLTYATAGT